MKYIFYRFTQMLIIIVFLSIALFALLSAMPGNPIDMLIMSNPRVKPEDVVRLKKLRGLDKPWYVQYVRWIWGFHEPFRPATIEEINPISVKLENHQAAASINLKNMVLNNDFRLNLEEAKILIQNDRPKIWQSIEANTNLIDVNSGERIDLILEQVVAQDPSYYQQLQQEIKKRSLQELSIKGLFGAIATQFVVKQNFATPGSHRIWFVITNKAGLETVGSVAVNVTDEKTNENTNSKFVFDAIPVQIVDDPNQFKVDLASYLRSNAASSAAKYRYELLENSPGNIDENGVYSHHFEGQGQSAILFAAYDKHGNIAKGAFSVEKSPIPDPARFNEGFIFAFTGNKNALGFSNTYKRPVWELLAGPPVVCGDSNVDPGETCDDGNLINNDGCTAKCQLENLSQLAKISNTITGFIVSSGRIGNTLQLMIPAILLSLLIALPLGILSAYRQYSWLDYIVNFFAFIGISLPVFWFGIMIIYLFAENMQWFPAGGMQTPGIHEEGLSAVLSDRIIHAILPTVVLSIAYIGRWLRYMRASMLEILPADYIRTARAKGLSEKVVILKHALRNALIPVVTILALSIPALFGGAVLTETVFAWPGIGRLEYDAIVNSDYYVAIVVFLISSVLVMVGNLLADLLYVVVDPRMRHG